VRERGEQGNRTKRVQDNLVVLRCREMAHLCFLLWLILCVDQGYSAEVFGKAEFIHNVTGVLKVLVHKEESNRSVLVSGELAGLPIGQFQLNLVRGGCGDEGNLLEELYEWDQSDGDIVRVGTKSLKVLLNNKDILSLIVERCVMLDGEFDCDVGEKLGCAELVWDYGGLGMEIIIIIIVAVVIFLLTVICVPLICCCIRSRSKQKIPTSEEDLDSLDDPFHLNHRSKSPMYDELSLPFIDASLPPTPKIGRTVNGLDILLGHNSGSRTSLSER